MSKRKIVIVAVAILVAVALFMGVYYGLSAYRKHKKETINFEVKDTLPDGGGKKATVILLGGQSNASGCSYDEYLEKKATPEKYAQYKAGYDNVYINYYVSDNNISNGFVKCSTCQGELGTRFGPELGLAEKLHEDRPDETFFIIKCAWGGTNLFEQWRAPSSAGKTGILYRNFTKFVDESLEYLVSKNYDIKIEGMCWMQGESDSFSIKNGTNYEDNLNDFIGDIRKRYKKYASDDGIAFIDAYIADNPVFWVYYDLVNESKRKVAEATEINVVIDTVAAGLTCNTEPEDQPDIPHYDALSEIKLGNLFAEEVMKFFD